MQIPAERVVEVLKSMASSTYEGAKRIEDGARLIATSGDVSMAISNAAKQARFHADVMNEAAAIVEEATKGK